MRITTALLALNILLFAGIGMLPATGQEATLSNYAFSMDNFTGGKPWTIITSMFLHGSIVHLSLNMIALYFFGGALETAIRDRDYLLIYFAGGMAGNIAAAMAFSSGQLSIGASGAIFALMGAAMLAKPFDFVAYPWVIPVPIIFVGAVMIASNILLALSPPPGSNISFASHVGGFSVGLLYGLYYRGITRGMIILITALLLLFLTSQYLAPLALLDYTQALRGLAG